jgi:hypothetical protein
MSMQIADCHQHSSVRIYAECSSMKRSSSRKKTLSIHLLGIKKILRKEDYVRKESKIRGVYNICIYQLTRIDVFTDAFKSTVHFHMCLSYSILNLKSLLAYLNDFYHEFVSGQLQAFCLNLVHT